MLVVVAAEAVFLLFSLLGVMLTDSCTPSSTALACGPGLLAIVAVPFLFGLASLICIVVGWVALARRRRAWAWGLLGGSTAAFFVYWVGAAAVVTSF